MKKTILSIILIITLLTSTGISTISQAAPKFSDVPADAWYLNDMNYIVQDARRILNGFPDGTYRPDAKLNVADFIKCVITARGITLENGKEYWAQHYIEEAKKWGYVVPFEFDSTSSDPYEKYKQPITRGEMARIVSRAVPDITGKYEFRDTLLVLSTIKDYDSIPAGMKQSVVKCYDMGILGGFTDGTFRADRHLSRAEAVAVIRRMIDPASRLVIELPEAYTPDIIVVDGITFNPATDYEENVRGHAHDWKIMKLDKVEEFVMLFMNNLKFVERNGEYFCEGYIPNLPEGYEWGLSIQLEYSERVVSGGTLQEFSPESIFQHNKLPSGGNHFSMLLRGTKHNLKSVVLPITVKTKNDHYSGNFLLVYSPNQKTLRRVDKYNNKTTYVEFNVEGIFQW